MTKPVVFGVEVTAEKLLKLLVLAFTAGMLYAKLNAVGDLLAQKIEALDKRVTRIESKMDR